MPSKKVSLSLDETLVHHLDFIASRAGVSRSALVNELLSESLPQLREVFELIPESPTPADVLRFRGESVAVIQERMDSARRALDDLFADQL